MALSVILIVRDNLVTPLAAALTQWRADIAAENWILTTRVVVDADDAETLVAETNALNPDAVFLLGDVPVPFCGPINPDGHSTRMYPSDAPFGVPVNWFVFQNQWFNVLRPSQTTRRVGRFSLGGMIQVTDPIAEYNAYFARTHASRTGAKIYEQRGYIIDHLSFDAPIGQPGNVSQFGPPSPNGGASGMTLWLGAPGVFRNDQVDHDPDQGGSGFYYDELNGHSWALCCQYSGGYGATVFADGYAFAGGGLFYVGNTAAALAVQRSVASPASRPDVAYWSIYGSSVGEWTNVNDYERALPLTGLGCINITDVNNPPYIEFGDMRTKPFPQIIVDAQNVTLSIAYSYMGDPTLPVLAFGAPPPAPQSLRGVGIAAHEVLTAGALSGPHNQALVGVGIPSGEVLTAGTLAGRHNQALVGVGIPSAEVVGTGVLSGAHIQSLTGVGIAANEVLTPGVLFGAHIQRLAGVGIPAAEVLTPGHLAGGGPITLLTTYPVGSLVDDSGAILTAPVVTVTSVVDKSGSAITGGVAATTVNGSGTATPISVTYDAELHGEAWIILSVTQAAHTITNRNAAPVLYATKDSSRISVMYALMVVDTVQASPAPSATVFAGSSALNGVSNAAYLNAYLVFVTGANAGETHRILSYVASTRTMTMNSAFPAAPTAGDIFAIVGRNE